MRLRTPLLTAFWITLGSTGSTLADSGFIVESGLGYEYMSQEFFLDAERLSGSDSLELTTQLKTTYLDDFKGSLSLSYVPYNDHRLEIRSSAEQTPDQLRLRLSTGYRPHLGPLSLDWSGEIERRHDRSVSESGNSGYVSGYGRGKIGLPVSNSVTLWTAARGDFVYFDSATQDIYDYWRVGGQLGMDHTFNNFSNLTLDLFINKREVLLNGHQDYLARGLAGSFFGFYSKGQIDALIRFETRDYDRELALGDYRRNEIAIANRHDLGGSFFAKEAVELEWLRYDTTDIVPRDYTRAELTLLAGLSQDSWSVALGPEMESLHQPASRDYTFGEEYVEFGLMLQIDVVKLGAVFASLESVFGRRDLQSEGGSEVALSDFLYERLNLLADWTVSGGFGLSALLAADWEWHDRADENSRLYLLTTSLNYSF